MSPIRQIYVYATLTTAVAILLSILPLPYFLTHWQVSWPHLVVVYWCIALPHQFGIKYAWVTGLIMDLFHQDIFGQNAILFIALAYAAILLRQFILYLPAWQQALLIGIMLLIPTTLSVWFNIIIYDTSVSWHPWGTIASSIIAWPWVFAVLRLLRQKTQLASR